jgi:hypothetical protein
MAYHQTRVLFRHDVRMIELVEEASRHVGGIQLG